MAPKPKNVPSRLGPPPQLQQLHEARMMMAAKKNGVTVMRQSNNNNNNTQKFQPKMKEIMARQAKMMARWAHVNLTWKKILMSWMVLLVASKMVLLMLTYQFFTLTALISLQIFHGVWTIAFFCLNVIDSKAVLPNASCLLAGYLPATTVLHILLIPNDYPLEYIITDAVGTFLAIITMFLLLRMECTEILHEAEYMWENNKGSTNNIHSDTTSESGLSSCSSGSCSTRSNGVEINTPNGRRILGNPSGPTIITVSAVNQRLQREHLAAQLDSMLYQSMEEPVERHLQQQPSSNITGISLNPFRLNSHSAPNSPPARQQQHPQQQQQQQQQGRPRPQQASSPPPTNSPPSGGNGQVLFDEAVDLEPIDFEHFVDEPEMNRNQSERMFQVTLGSSPPMRGR